MRLFSIFPSSFFFFLSFPPPYFLQQGLMIRIEHYKPRGESRTVAGFYCNGDGRSQGRSDKEKTEGKKKKETLDVTPKKWGKIHTQQSALSSPLLGDHKADNHGPITGHGKGSLCDGSDKDVSASAVLLNIPKGFNAPHLHEQCLF